MLFHGSSSVSCSGWIEGELEETIVDLDCTRQKIAALRNEKDATSGKPLPLVGVKREASDKMEEKPFQDTKALEGAVEEAKVSYLVPLM